MIDYLKKEIKDTFFIKEDKKLYDRFPLAFRGQYILYKVQTGDTVWFALQPKVDIKLPQLRKDRKQIEQSTALPCAFLFEAISFYIKKKLLEESIPFVLKNKMIFLPFLGHSIPDRNIRMIQPIRHISYLTQKMILLAIYERWKQVTVTQASSKLSISKMSVSRCFDEIEYFNIDILSFKGKSRVITIPNNREGLWNDILPILRNPVIERFELQEDIHLKNQAGISALCEYSLLSDNKYPTYAVTKKEISSKEIRKKALSYPEENPGCVVLELGYFINYDNNNIQDPLSIFLSLTEEEKTDDRIIISVNEMLKEYVWSKG